MRSYGEILQDMRGALIPGMSLLLLPATLLGCGAPITVRPISPEEIASLRMAGDPTPQAYGIEPGDTIALNYTYHPEMKQEEVVRPDGKITANRVGEIHVAGMTTAQLEQVLERATADRLRAPEVTVRILRHGDKHVYVGGEVGKPGLIPYHRGLTALQAILAAGGFQDTARLDSVILVRTDASGQNVVSRTLNLQEVVTSGVKDLLVLAPQDVLYVPRSGIAEADLWVRQHITELIPFIRGAGATLPVAW
jgi:protein involved in polysaccharide export with SLBB domain